MQNAERMSHSLVKSEDVWPERKLTFNGLSQKESN